MELTDERYLQVFERVGKNDTQNVFTPPRLIRRMLNRIDFTSNCKVLVWYNVEFLIYLVKEVGLSPKNIYIYTNTEDKLILEKQGYNVVYHESIDFDKIKNELKGMEFDVVIGNPPYHIKVGPKKTEPIWNKFVFKSIELCREGGFLSLIHPSGWRNVSGKFKNVQNELKKYKMNWLSINSIEEGLKVFGAQIRFDVYIIQKIKNSNELTTIEFQDGEVELVDIKSLEFIPNGNLELVKRILGNIGDEKLKILYSRSSYGSDKSNISKHPNNENQYPCVYSINVREIPKFLYSNTNQNGHFGIPKFIIPNGDARSIGFIKDLRGKYGLTQFACAIQEDSEEIQNKYHKLFRDKKFINFHNTYLCIGKTQYNWKTLELFKKDFWKEFIDE